MMMVNFEAGRVHYVFTTGKIWLLIRRMDGCVDSHEEKGRLRIGLEICV